MAILLLEITVRAALAAAGTACILWALRVRAAALRHTAWTMVVVAMLLLPVWSIAGPSLRLAILSAGTIPLDADPGADPSAGTAASGAATTRPEPTAIEKDASAVGGSSRAMSVLAAVYLLGALTLLARLAIGTVQANRLRRGAVTHGGRATSERCATPVTVGWLSPVLILPEGWDRWPARRLAAVEAHEREHARRRDPLVQWVALLNRALFWFHPLAWWLERRLGSLAEEICDRAVIRAGHSPQDYSDDLLDMARTLTRQGRRLDVVGMAMPGSNLAPRLRRIFEEFPMAPLTRSRVFCTLALCAASSIVCAAAVLAPRPSVGAQSPPAFGSSVRTADIPLWPLQSAPSPQPIGEASLPVRPVPGVAAQPATEPVPNTVAPAQIDRPDFSGHWTFVSSTTTRSGTRGGTPPGGDPNELVKTTARWLSLGAVNCGNECTIVQNGKTLTITLAADQPDTPKFAVPVAVLNLDGSDSSLTPFGGPPFVVHANWAGNTLIVTHVWAYMTITQRLSIEDGMLKVVNDTGVGYPPGTFTYARQ